MAGFWMARLAGGQDSPVFSPAVCSLSNVHLCWKCRVTWACSLCFLSCCCCRGGNFTCSAHAESKTHAVRFCSDPSDLISCHSTPGGTDGYFMAFFFSICVPRINKVIFPEAECVNGGGMRTWKL